MQAHKRHTGVRWSRFHPPGQYHRPAVYEYLFLLGDGSGCVKLLLNGRTPLPDECKAAARMRLAEARACAVKPAHLLP